MNTDSQIIEVSGLAVHVVRKNIKNLHLSVCPPDGKVRVSAPQRTSNENVRLAVISRLPWIKRKKAEFEKQPRQSERHYVSGESHYFQGRRYILELVERSGPPEFQLLNNAKMRLSVRPDTPKDKRAQIVNEWYRDHLKEVIPSLLKKWQPIVGKQVSAWRIQKMKTKWGSCNIEAKRILLNLELAKKSPECLEYILVHELVHLHERHHNDNFVRLMDRFMPKWRISRDILKSEPLAHEEWEY
ncbi:MAG: M48 family metallopeptidase [Roseitalea sp.]|nr:M48 family metallopeptidase [Roseitalea sp.]MBO6952779.1 M48 family metallopeptidase [Rhizobiaceae bacterium]MBO6592734.1 M48 family metallopeptidase [Roseitalea sp.]MBO6600523.1 M48 family metallopeptidase [Roseitalea sp.]MBO6612935.1 M48 family metallopeptidase [Roseitalea sp.]